ncbi:ABC transporter substrate-binding protein (plasmid) [Paracoccus versutus]|uniref:Spermidine/putrescine transport system substrate-binding protein n=1 Tax=Paracoccus versutus TaxID=34007 RepID=A0AAQ0KMY3_PARVE|nr:ABC transporter substrate-binding protein [Paracoccus versutus]KGJ02624.1 ABC transporter substrate-binding protein [Paracoccus versutus]REG54210.1 putative spermidine/putrescine transport system substrate-binding protein [Paracoccus versutus]WEJ80397.1 ABC transporter substrate-binding protein [Paracoccus versutus]
MFRKFALTTTVAAAAALGPIAAASAQELVVGAFGGSFADNVETCYVQPFTQATGASVLLKPASSAQHAASVRATAGQSDMDVVFADDAFAVQMANEGLLVPLDRATLANAPDIIEGAWGKGDAYVAAMLGATTIVYNKDTVATPPSSWNDLFDPKYEGRITIGDVSATAGWQFLAALNQMEGGTLQDPGPGLAKIKPLAQSAVLLHTQADQVVSLFERGEIDIAVWYPDRAGVAIKGGLPLAVAYPQEGAVGIRPTISIPKGTQQQELALKFIDTVLSVEAQKCFSEAQVIGPVNSKVVLSDDLASILPSAEQAGQMLFLDPAEMAVVMPDWTRRWQREVLR